MNEGEDEVADGAGQAGEQADEAAEPHPVGQQHAASSCFDS